MAWINFKNLGSYHEKIKVWIEKNKYIHPANHPATMIIQDSTNQFVTKEQKENWTKKLDADANAVSASKLNKPVKINGIEFDGTKDIELKSNFGFEESNYYVRLNENTSLINLPEKYLERNPIINLYIDGIKLIQDKNYTVNLTEKNINLNETYANKIDVEVIFIYADFKISNLLYTLLPNQKDLTIQSDKKFTTRSILHFYIDGKKLIENLHYNFNYETKTLTLVQSFSYKTDLEILIIKE